MKEIYGHYDIFTMSDSNAEENLVCVTTNGIIKRDGTAVMGAGVAKTADTRFHLAAKLASHLRVHGNTVADLGTYKYGNSAFHIASFPTKNHWRDNSIPELIRKSAEQLVRLADAKGFKRIFLVPPGCGCGGLDYKADVKPILENIFDDRFVIVFRT